MHFFLHKLPAGLSNPDKKTQQIRMAVPMNKLWHEKRMTEQKNHEHASEVKRVNT